MKSKKYKNLEELIAKLPNHSFSINGKQMEPVCLVIEGNKRQIRRSFRAAGWYLADSIGFISTLKSAVSSLLNLSYRDGPMWPSYINGKKHQLGFERPTKTDTYRRRHHLRLWTTGFKVGKKRVWVGTISYDRGIGRFKGSLLPTHHIGPTLVLEEGYLARTFDIQAPKYLRLGQSETGVINTGDDYVWDGRALIINLK
ncbi:MAG TPA: LssY C-terminal domain-containing protein [Candidatus Binatia bacterium]|nr:LssY C-terminal domain-containing protein [Candidatus Binatia bacterium]